MSEKVEQVKVTAHTEVGISTFLAEKMTLGARNSIACLLQAKRTGIIRPHRLVP